MTHRPFWIPPPLILLWYAFVIIYCKIKSFIAVYDHQSDDKFRFWRPFWIFPSLTCRGNGGFVDYGSGGVAGHLQKNSAFSIFFLG